MEKINRNITIEGLDILNENWEFLGESWKNQDSNDFSWTVMLRTGEEVNLRKKILNKALIRLTKNRCPFCDYYPLSNRAHYITNWSIEHFYPKERDGDYWHLAYQWGNLFPICERCNNEKGNKSVVNVLKPDLPDYKFEDYFDVNPLGKIAVNVRKRTKNQEMAQATIDAYQLNRGELKENRRKALEKFEFLFQAVGVKVLEKFPLEEEPYQFFIKRYLINEYVEQDFDQLYAKLMSNHSAQ